MTPAGSRLSGAGAGPLQPHGRPAWAVWEIMHGKDFFPNSCRNGNGGILRIPRRKMRLYGEKNTAVAGACRAEDQEQCGEDSMTVAPDGLDLMPHDRSIHGF